MRYCPPLIVDRIDSSNQEVGKILGTKRRNSAPKTLYYRFLDIFFEKTESIDLLLSQFFEKNSSSGVFFVAFLL